MIIDIHAHYTTAPPELNAYRGRQLSSLNKPTHAALSIPDDRIRESLQGHLQHMADRGIDVLFFSPRASGMGHDVGSVQISEDWTRVNNDLIAQATGLFPGRFIPVCQLPQSPGVSPEHSVTELRRCVEELGFVGCNINPDVSGGVSPLTPSLGDRWWYPLWEAMVELDVPAMVHASSTQNPALHVNGSHYVAQDYAAVVELCSSRVFDDFPDLRLIIPHGGGAIPYQFNRHRALHAATGLPPFEERVRNLYFDTALYDEDSLAMLLGKIDADRLLFGSEMFGTAKSRDPRTGRYFDDNVGMIKSIPGVDRESLHGIFELNARRVYPRAAAHLERLEVPGGTRTREVVAP